MLNDEARQAVSELAEAMMSVRPLVDLLEHPVRIASGGGYDVRTVIDRVASRLGSPPFDLAGADGHGVDNFGRVVGEHLNLNQLGKALSTIGEDALPQVDTVVDSVAADDFDAFCATATVTATDGVRFPAYAAGDPGTPAVVIASACGMPARLAERWIRHLAVEHYVLTWESRGLFGDLDEFDGATDVAAQAGDLIAVMDHFGLRAGHVAGLCGGAVIALAAARREPERVSSLSLWHGDFDLGPDTPKTDHQRNLQALMAMATEARVSASGIHAVLCQSMLESVPPDLAHLVLYPYATPEVLFRYCQLNGAIMGTNVGPDLAGIAQPTLVVTSRDDGTAHPEGSRLVADALPDSRLLVTEHGDHISLFRGQPQLLDAAGAFIPTPDRG